MPDSQFWTLYIIKKLEQYNKAAKGLHQEKKTKQNIILSPDLKKNPGFQYFLEYHQGGSHMDWEERVFWSTLGFHLSSIDNCLKQTWLLGGLYCSWVEPPCIPFLPFLGERMQFLLRFAKMLRSTFFKFEVLLKLSIAVCDSQFYFLNVKVVLWEFS